MNFLSFQFKVERASVIDCLRTFGRRLMATNSFALSVAVVTADLRFQSENNIFRFDRFALQVCIDALAIRFK